MKPSFRRSRRILPALAGLALAGLTLAAAPALAQHPTAPPDAPPPAAPRLLPKPVPPPRAEPLRVFGWTMRHRQALDMLDRVRPLLSARGTVEVQPGANTLVIRDTDDVIVAIARTLDTLDQPPSQVRFEIRMLHAGPARKGGGVISPPQAAVGTPLEEDLAGRLRDLLRYDEFRVLAKAGLSSSEGERVTYALGDGFDLSFKLSAVIGNQRVKLEDFRVVQKVANQTDKSRRLEPEQLFHATLNIWLDKTFTLVLEQDKKSQEALMIAIACRREPVPARGLQRRP